MKIKNLIILSCLSVFAFMSCETTERIDDFPLRPSQLVVNCNFTEGVPFAFQVSKSLSVLDNADLKLVDSAKVKLFRGDELIETLTAQNELGWYVSEISIPEAGKTYSIEVTSPDFENVLLSEEIAPNKVPISDVTIQIKDSSFYEWEDHRDGSIRYGGNIEGSFKIVFSDPAETDNYYTLNAFYMDTIYDNYEDKDDWHLEKRPLSLSSEDAAIDNDGDNYIILMFRDEFFNGQDYKISAEFYDYQAMRGKEYFIELTTLGRAGYLYKKSIDDYFLAINDPFAEPVQIFGNIENGYGIFMGHSISIFPVTF